jgi:hypothetical protein
VANIRPSSFEPNVIRKTIPALVLLLETALAAYVSAVVWLLSVWMIDDSRAALMLQRDWYVEGVRRFFAALVIGLLFGGIVFLVNRRWVTPLLPNSPKLPTGTAWALACCIVLAGAAGAIQFIVTKPWF